MSMNQELHMWAYYIGIILIFVTHIRMLSTRGMTNDMITTHAVTNLIAGCMIAYYFMTKEKMLPN